ncbi:MBG domain-containing protein [Bifidobacterium sp.]|uniref:MBG domain-containing protein n=1 Tax=Bifidobacterium sp. TaxID=41200 RepID=UPI0039E83465
MGKHVRFEGKRGSCNLVKYLAMLVSIVMLFSFVSTNASADSSADEALESQLIGVCSDTVADGVEDEFCEGLVEAVLGSSGSFEDGEAATLVEKLSSPINGYLDTVIAKITAKQLTVDGIEAEIKKEFDPILAKAVADAQQTAYDVTYDFGYTKHFVEEPLDSQGQTHTDAYWAAYDTEYETALGEEQEEVSYDEAVVAQEEAQSVLEAAQDTLDTYQALDDEDGLIEDVVAGESEYTEGTFKDEALDDAMTALQSAYDDYASKDGASTEAQAALDAAETQLADAIQALTDQGHNEQWCTGEGSSDTLCTGDTGYNKSLEKKNVAEGVVATANSELTTSTEALNAAKAAAVTVAQAASGRAQTAVSEAQTTLDNATAVAEGKGDAAEQAAIARAEAAGAVAETGLRNQAVSDANSRKASIGDAVTAGMNALLEAFATKAAAAQKTVEDLVDAAAETETDTAETDLEEIKTDLAAIKTELESIKDNVTGGIASAKKRYQALYKRLLDLNTKAQQIAPEGITTLASKLPATVDDAITNLEALDGEIDDVLETIEDGFAENLSEALWALALNNDEAASNNGCVSMQHVIAAALEEIETSESANDELSIEEKLTNASAAILEEFDARLKAGCTTILNDGVQVWADEIPVAESHTYDGEVVDDVVGDITLQIIEQGHVTTAGTEEYALAYAAVKGTASNTSNCPAQGSWEDSESALALKNAGIYNICVRATYDATAYYTQVKYTIKQKAISVRANGVESEYGESLPTLTYAVSGDTQLVEGDSLTGSLTVGTATNVGAHAITQNKDDLIRDSSGNDNYKITFTSGTLTITPREIVVCAADTSKTFGDKDVFSYEVGRYLEDDDNDDCDAEGGLVGSDTLKGVTYDRDAGENANQDYTVRVLVDVESNPNYDVKVKVDGKLTINRRPLTIDVDKKAITYGDANPKLTYTFGDKTAPVDDEALTIALAVNTGDSKYAPVGTYDITATVTGKDVDNYTITKHENVLQVKQRAIAIKASDTGKVYGYSDPGSLQYAVSSKIGLVEGDTLSGISVIRDAGENAGTYALRFAEAESDISEANPNYALTLENGVFTIKPRPLTITPKSLSKAFGAKDPASFPYAISAGTVFGDDDPGIVVIREAGENVGTYKYLVDARKTNKNYAISVSKSATFKIVNNAAMDEVVDIINDLPDTIKTPADAEKVLEATKALESLTDAERAQILGKIKDRLAALQKQALKVNQSDSTGNTVESKPALPWYVRLVVEPENTADHTQRFARFIDGDTKLEAVFDVHLVDSRNNKEYELPEGQAVTVTINDERLSGLSGGKVIHEIAADSFEEVESAFDAQSKTVSFKTSSFSYFAVFSTGQNDALGKTGSATLPLAAIAAVLVLCGSAILISKRMRMNKG